MDDGLERRFHGASACVAKEEGEQLVDGEVAGGLWSWRPGATLPGGRADMPAGQVATDSASATARSLAWLPGHPPSSPVAGWMGA